jgi:hypothetical protein
MAILTNDSLTNAVLTNEFLTNGKTPFRKLRVMLRLVLNFGTKTNHKSQSATQTQPNPKPWIFQSMKYSQYDKKLYYYRGP